MTQAIQLVDVGDFDVDSIFAGEKEQYWVDYNHYWLDISHKHEDITAKLIRVDGIEKPVGFMVYGQHYADGDLTQAIPQRYSIIHLVIDQAHQGKGYGKQTVLLVMDILKTIDDCQEIVIAHHSDNLRAHRLYESLGFVEFDRDYEGDPLLRLRLKK